MQISSHLIRTMNSLSTVCWISSESAFNSCKMILRAELFFKEFPRSMAVFAIFTIEASMLVNMKLLIVEFSPLTLIKSQSQK